MTTSLFYSMPILKASRTIVKTKQCAYYAVFYAYYNYTEILIGGTLRKKSMCFCSI